MKLKIAVVLAVMVLLLQGAVTQIYQGTRQNSWVITPQFLPNVAADAVTHTTFVCYLEFVNQTGGAVTITILDKQGSPMPMFQTASIAANSTWIALQLNPATGCRYFPNGINWVASAANSVSVSMNGIE